MGYSPTVSSDPFQPDRTLDPQALVRLRDALAAVKQGRGVPRAAVARLAEALPDGLGLTVDFQAAAVLGQPMVVLRPSRVPDPCFGELTPREREVAGLLAVGLRNRDIALALDISVGTVKDHVHRILAKSGLDSRAAVAARWTG